MWGGVSQIRDELVSKAKICVPQAYGFSGMSAEDIKELVNWMVKTRGFLNGDLDVKVSLRVEYNSI